jgi:orotidine-5'-phosphate decarboxylase
MNAARDRLIVALDVPSVEQARMLINALGDSVGVYKIGLELLFSGGLTLASELVGKGASVFIDAKLLDIEATVERATAAIAGNGAQFLTVHALDC